MAVTATLQPGGQKSKRWIVTFGLDADITAVLDHGFNGAPGHVELVPLNAEFYVGQVFRGPITTTQITITKNAALGSGGASVEVIAFIPHSTL